jgi:hypothetical protein
VAHPDPGIGGFLDFPASSDGDVFEHSDDRYRPGRSTFTIDNAPEGRPSLVRTHLPDAATNAQETAS